MPALNTGGLALLVICVICACIFALAVCGLVIVIVLSFFSKKDSENEVALPSPLAANQITLGLMQGLLPWLIQSVFDVGGVSYDPNTDIYANMCYSTMTVEELIRMYNALIGSTDVRDPVSRINCLRFQILIVCELCVRNDFQMPPNLHLNHPGVTTLRLYKERQAAVELSYMNRVRGV
jgi:hypothetical protein